MAKVKTIAGVTYYPIKVAVDGVCCLCGTCVKDSTAAYLVGSLTTKEIMCVKCVNNIYTRNQIVKDLSVRKFPTETPIFIGTKHRCGAGALEGIPFFFANQKKKRKLTIKHCPKCQGYFIPLDVYTKNEFYFLKYQLISSQSGRPIVSSVAKDVVVLNRRKEYEKDEIPESLQWAAKHPYQGGSFSSK